MTPHAFRPHPKKPLWCAVCQNWSGAPWHSLELLSGTDNERTAALELAAAARMTGRLHSVKEDISQAAGEMERESPLFRGTGANPCLF